VTKHPSSGTSANDPAVYSQVPSEPSEFPPTYAPAAYEMPSEKARLSILLVTEQPLRNRLKRVFSKIFGS
jgi:hypothetical protein